jgi:hypothetical protein
MIVSHFLSQNWWVGIESIITISAFAVSMAIFLKQRKELIFQQKTSELRNEMIAMFSRIGHYNTYGRSTATAKKNPLTINTEFDTTFDPSNVRIFLESYFKIRNHNNKGLLREFKLHKVTGNFCKTFESKNRHLPLVKELRSWR